MPLPPASPGLIFNAFGGLNGKFASEYQDVVNETSVWNREREDLLGRLRDTGRDVDLEEELADMEARLEDAREAVRQARGKAAAQVNELQVRCETLHTNVDFTLNN